jgi:hypothetical protein
MRWRGWSTGSPRGPQVAERAQLNEAITALGLALDEHPFRPGQEGATAAMRRDLLRALDAYEQAKRMVPDDDALGVLGTLDDGRHALACLDARLAGRHPPDRMPSCFFDTGHGRATAEIRWAPEGGRERLVAVCATDAARLAGTSGPRGTTRRPKPSDRAALGRGVEHGGERPVVVPDAPGPFVLRVTTTSAARLAVSVGGSGRQGLTHRVHGGDGLVDTLLPLTVKRGRAEVHVSVTVDGGATGTEWGASAHILDDIAAHDEMSVGHGDSLVRYVGQAGPAVFAHRGPGRFELLALNGRLARWATAASGTGDQDVRFPLPGAGWYQIRARGSWTLTSAPPVT